MLVGGEGLMATCWNCNRRFNVPEDDDPGEHGCPRCGDAEQQDLDDYDREKSEDDDGDG